MMVDIDTRLKNLIGKNRQITQTYIEKAKAIKEEKKKLEETNPIPSARTTTTGKEETKKGAENKSEVSVGVATAPDKGSSKSTSQLIVDEKPHLAHAGSLLDDNDAASSSSKQEKAGKAVVSAGEKA